MKIWIDDQNEYYTTNSDYNNYNEYKLVNHISFVDCPGHHTLIQTMLSSISLMDGAIIVIAVDQPINKKNQLIQHLIAAKLGKLDKIIICLNKIDLVSKNILLTRKKELDDILLKYEIKPYIIIICRQKTS
jgi:translation initiation factor 2 subunit 3